MRLRLIGGFVLLTLTGAVLSGPALWAGPMLPSQADVSAEDLRLGQERVGKAREALSRAVDRFRRQDPEACLEHLRQARREEPGLPPARLILARLYLATHQPGRGRVALEEAAQDHPDNGEVALAFAELALGEGRLADAAAQLEKAAARLPAEDRPQQELRSLLAQAHAGLAAVAERRGDTRSAEAQLRAWLALDPGSGEAHHRLGKALFARGKEEAAFEELKRGAEQDRSLPSACTTMGRLLAERGDSENAGQWMDRAVQEQPGEVRVRLEVADWLLDTGRVEEARKQVLAAAALDPKSVPVRRGLGLVARLGKDYAEAERHFQQLHLDMPAEPGAADQLALSLIEQSEEAKRDRALQLAEVNVRQYPNDPQLLATLGWVYYRLGRIEEAEQTLQKAFAGGTVSSETAYYLARVLWERGRPDESRRLVKSALAAPGRFPHRHEAQAWLRQISAKP